MKISELIFALEYSTACHECKLMTIAQTALTGAVVGDVWVFMEVRV